MVNSQIPNLSETAYHQRVYLIERISVFIFGFAAECRAKLIKVFIATFTDMASDSVRRRERDWQMHVR